MGTPPTPNLQIGVMLPGEALAIAVINLVSKIVDGQPPDVKKQLWQWYIEDMKAWRALWGLKP